MTPRAAAVAILLVAVIVGAMATLLRLGGFDVALALSALWHGSVGSWYAFTSATLVRVIPLLLTGTAVAIAFRAGVLNIGGEGQLLIGAAGTAAVALAFPGGGWVTVLVALLAGALAGAGWAGIAGILRVRFGVLEVISTIMLNFVALYLVSFLVRGPLQEPTHAYPQSRVIAQGVHLLRLPGAGRLHVGLLLAVAVALWSGWFLRHSAAGFRLVAVGESPTAAASAGLIGVGETMTKAFLASGAIAGLAGACEVLGVTFALYEDISPGYGYTAIAIALLARLDPWLVIPAALLFAALEAGAGAMQRDAGVPASLVTVIEAALILAAAVVPTLRRGRGHAACRAGDPSPAA